MSSGAAGGSSLTCAQTADGRNSAARKASQLRKAAVDLLAGFKQFLHRIDADVEVFARLRIESDLHDPFNAAGAEHDRHPDIKVVDAILAGEVRRGGKHALLV